MAEARRGLREPRPDAMQQLTFRVSPVALSSHDRGMQLVLIELGTGAFHPQIFI
jgi:hypothetical protein